MYCKYCGKIIPEEADFCPYCGKRLKHKEPDCAELVQRIQQDPNDQEAITGLYQLSYKTAYNAAYVLLRGEDEIFDVIQNSFLKALKNLNKLETPENFNAWYKTIVRNTAIDFMKKNDRLVLESTLTEGADEEDEGNSVFDTYTPLNAQEQQLLESQIEAKEVRNLLDCLLKELSPAQQTMVGLRFYCGMKEKDIAEQLGVAEGTVKSGISRAMKKMKKELTAYCQRTGTKFYSIAPAALLLWLFSRLDSKACTVSVNMDLLHNITEQIQPAHAEAAEAPEPRTVHGAPADGNTAAASMLHTASAAAAGKTAAVRIAVGILCAAAAGGAGVAAVHHYRTAKVETESAEVQSTAVLESQAGESIDEEGVLPEEDSETAGTRQEESTSEMTENPDTAETVVTTESIAAEAQEETDSVEKVQESGDASSEETQSEEAQKNEAEATPAASSMEDTEETPESRETYLISGPDFKQAIYNLPGITTQPGETDYVINNIYAVERTDKAPTEACDAVQVSESGEPAYIWLWDGTLYWYTEAETVYLNEDSSEMFAGLFTCKSIDMTGFNTSRVTSMEGMFYACCDITSLDLSDFDTSKVTNFQSMFSACEDLTTLDLSGFDMSAASKLPSDYFDSPYLYMLFDCYADVSWWPEATEMDKEIAWMSP